MMFNRSIMSLLVESISSLVREAISAASLLLAILGIVNLIADIISACNTLSLALAENGVAVVPSTNLYNCE